MSFRDLFRWSNTHAFLATGVRAREASETEALYRRVSALQAASPFDGDRRGEFVFDLVNEACERAGVFPTVPLGDALFNGVWELLHAEGIYVLPEQPRIESLTINEGASLRTFLRRKERFLSDHERLFSIWREKVLWLLSGILGYLPPTVFGDDPPELGEQHPPLLTVPFIDLCDKPAEVIERAIVTLFDKDVIDPGLFEAVRDRLEANFLIASGIDPAEAHSSSRKTIFPTEAKDKTNAMLVESYCRGTGFFDLFTAPLPFEIPFPARFEHTHIVGGSGHGKTQLLQLLIHQDLEKAREDFRSIVVIDSQGDLFRTISQLACFDPSADGNLADRLVLIDPTDVEYPVALNMFDWSRERLSTLAPADRERMVNGIIALYEYFFGALLGAELTQKQGVIFKYLARLMLEIPDATVHTFRELMEHGEQFRPYMEQLPATARSFFETRFFDRTFAETKKQVLTRLWGVLSNAVFERMFSHPRSKVNLFEATNTGKIILINTAKDLLKEEGCAIFGRFFIALLAQAAQERAVLKPHERNATFVYIDEAQDYFDQSIEALLNQARKYKVGMILAHQNLEQLSQSLRASVFASTSIKFVGGLSDKDAQAFASEMRTDKDFMRGMRKRKDHTEFACFVRNLTPQALSVCIPLGHVEKLPTLSDDALDEIRNTNRGFYCVPIEQIDVQEGQRHRAPMVARSQERPQDQVASVGAPDGDDSFPEQSGGVAAETPPTAPKDVPDTWAPLPARIGEGPKGPADQPTSPQPAAVEPAVAAPRARRAKKPTTPTEPGRGGREHKYLQHLIKGLAEERGFRAEIEAVILDGTGRVDVSLKKGDRRIAVEISVTTSRDHELENLEKCLAAGYPEVAVISRDGRYLKAMKTLVRSQLEPDDYAKVSFLAPEDIVELLGRDTGPPQPTEQVVRGYKVKVKPASFDPVDAESRRQAIAQVLARSIKS